jgi:Ca-activated chloride channel homolog
VAVRFLSPLGFLFAAALPVVVVFYLLKRKRVVRVVPSTVLWERFLAETQASAPFQRLRNNLLLWLQLLLVALAVMALTRPYFSGRVGEPGLDILVLDASASMQAKDESPSRFEKAREEVREMIDSLPRGAGGAQQMVVLVAGASTEVRQSATSDRALLRRAVDEAVVTDGPTRLGDALRVADALARNRSGARVHLFSDGAGVDLSEFENLDLNLIYHQVGRRSANAGIVSAEVKPDPEDPSRRAIFAGIANYGTNTLSAPVELSFEGAFLEAKTVTVAPSNTIPVVFIARQAKDGVFTVTLKTKDDLDADNEVRVVSLLPRPQRVLLVTKGNRFLARALAAASPNIEVATVAAYTPEAAARADTVVLDDVAPSAPPSLNTLAVHTVFTNWFDRGFTPVENPQIVDWRNTHPLLRFVSFDNVQAASSYAAATPSWAVSLAETTKGSLLLAGEIGRQRIVWIGFDTLNSTWPLRVSFPIFIANAMDWLSPSARTADQLAVRAGDPFRFSLDDTWGPVGPGASMEVRGPDGKAVQAPINERTREVIFSATGRQGLYKAIRGTNEVVFAVNLLDTRESNVTPREKISMGRRGEVAATKQVSANLERWRWFAAASLLVMLAEWWWFHRRTA